MKLGLILKISLEIAAVEGGRYRGLSRHGERGTVRVAATDTTPHASPMTAATARPFHLLLPLVLLLSIHASAAAAAAPCAPPLTCVAERVRAHLHRVKALLRHPAKDGDRDIVASLSAAEALVDPPSPTQLLSAEVHFSTGQWRRTRGHYSLAYASYSAALAANPAYVPALLNAAQAAAAINATDAAALLGRAVSVRPLRKVTAHAHTLARTHTQTHTNALLP